MGVYIGLVFVILIGGATFNVSDRKRTRNYCVFITLMLVLLIGLRSPELGISDTVTSYIPNFYRIQTMSFTQILTDINYSDKGYYLASKLFSMISNSAQAWIFICSIPFCVSTSMLIYKKSRKPSISYLVLLALSYFGYSFYLVRQMIALSLCLIAYMLYEEGKYKKAIIVFLIGVSFHVTALVSLFVLLLQSEKIRKRAYLVSISIVIICYTLAGRLVGLIFKLLKYDRIMMYTNNYQQKNMNQFIFYLLILAAVIMFAVIFKTLTDENKTYLLCFALATGFISMVSYVGNIYRIALYFGVYSIILIPNTIYVRNSQNRQNMLLQFIVGMLLIAMFLTKSVHYSNLVPYSFFWTY